MVVYREHAVPPVLSWAAACGWTLEAGPAGLAEWPVLPDAHIDVVAAAGGRVVLAGPATRVQLTDLPPGGAVAGVRLRPGTAAALIGVPAHAVRDQSPALVDLWPRWPGWSSDAEDHVQALADPRERLRSLYGLLIRRLPLAGPPDTGVRHAVDLIRAGNPTTAALAHASGLTTRQLLRRFDAAVGYGPKRLQRIVRLQRGLALHRAAPGTPLAQLAAAAGYADQAHLTRDWRALTGTTPRALLATRHVDVELAGGAGAASASTAPSGGGR